MFIFVNTFRFQKSDLVPKNVCELYFVPYIL